jgi:type IV secretory pathway VirJ component
VTRAARAGLAAAALAAVLASRVAAASAATIESTATLDPFGKVELYREAAHPGRVVLFLSDADGWNRPDVECARAIASLDALVVGVDLPRYLATIAERGGDELYPFADLEVLSQFVQKRLRLPVYVPPVVVGHGAGATMAYAVAAQARPTSVGAAVSLGFCPDLALPKPLGRGSGLLIEATERPGVYRLRPSRALAAPWTVLQNHAPKGCDPHDAHRFVDAAAGAELVALDTRDELNDPELWLPNLRRALERVSGPPAAAPTANGGVGDLPLVEVPAATGSGAATLAVILSGDGGWASLDREVGDALAKAGIGVVGVNSLSYFWTKRTPDGTAADLARVIRHYRAAWGATRVLLVGYSRGADVLPFLASRLPADLRAGIALVALLGPGRTTDFEFHLTDWLGGDDPTALPVAPEVAKLAGLRVLCVQGTDEDDSLCPMLDETRVRRFVLPGGHHFGGDYGVIAERILAEAAATTEPGAQPSRRSGVP